MSANNKISAEITAAQAIAITTSIADLKTNLSPVLLFNLTPDERRFMLKMGEKTLAFVGKALDYAVQNPTLVPAFLDVVEAKKDYTLAADLYRIYQQLNTLLQAIEDSTMVAGSEAYEAALVFYAAVKSATRSNVTGVRAIYDDLKQQFPAKRASKSINNP
ncbi:hypothetical protein [Pedobacter nototheniae]|uniref:hypothetical protein n=1 Tax=Pedobacter nototheniae TaxID=2488994 RepID=UPI001039773A|nr:hypothetical protein [Pedobacter nototheniae]